MKENFIENIENRFNLDDLYKKSLDVLEDDKILLGYFCDIREKEDLENDEAEVERLKKIFAENQTEDLIEAQKFGTVFEALIHHHGEMSNWFGLDSHTIKTSDYDDYKNGVDEILETNKEGQEASHLALAIDATTDNTAYKKLKSIWKNLKNGHLTDVKYFKSENSDKIELRRIPKVVVASSKKQIREVMYLWNNNKNMEIAEHPIQFDILDQIKTQLEIFKDWALENNPELVPVFEERLNLVNEILEDKKELRQKLEREGKFDEEIITCSEVIEKNLKHIMKTE